MKYYDFFRVTFEVLFDNIGFGTSIPYLNILLPVGLSFYVLRCISYSIDLYKNKIELSSLLDYSLYISFFPQLLSGPLARPGAFISQLKGGEARILDNSELYFSKIFIGLFKKLTIATAMGNIVDPIFTIPQNFSSLEILFAVYAYAIQIYCDFSGYSDMAIGIAGLLGFKSPDNFKTPYAALSIQEFWHRWHISFSTWLRDYVYIPLGGNRYGNLRRSINGITTMLISGLWHGAGVNFLIWGGIHGVSLETEKFIKKNTTPDKSSNKKSLFRNITSWIITFHIISIAWIFFRLESFKDAISILQNLFSKFFYSSNNPEMFLIVISALFFIAIEKFALVGSVIAQTKVPYLIRPLLITGIVVIIIELGPVIVPPFIYFKF